MSTTTITSTGQRSSIQVHNHPGPLNASGNPPMETVQEQFPPIDEQGERPWEIQSPQDIDGPEAPNINDQWRPRKQSHASWNARPLNGPYRHTRSRKSISEALESFRTRRGSVSANARELGDALKAPISWKLIVLCVIWYLTSALTNTSSKSILIAFPQPVTLTIVQFAFVSLWCILFAYLAEVFPSLKSTIPALKNGIRRPSPDVLLTALPLAVFQLLGHILSSTATAKIPVSLVHTIKGLSPLFTVAAYRVIFRIRYARATYLSLVPLTVGVMLACSADFSTNIIGIGCALAAAIVFVSQNIFSKKLFNEAARAEADGQGVKTTKLDKLNLLCYCSGIAFLLTAPIWLFTEGFSIIGDFLHDGIIGLSEKQGSLDHGALLLEFIFNGIFHFGQNIMAFILLSMVSPVSYSVASLIKRVWVIVVAILWFGNTPSKLQAYGICLTIFGLYLYDRTSHEDAADRRANADHFRDREALLPLSMDSRHPRGPNGHLTRASRASISEKIYESAGEYLKDLYPADSRKEDAPGRGRPRGNSLANSWLPPGTKQETTWEPGDAGIKP